MIHTNFGQNCSKYSLRSAAPNKKRVLYETLSVIMYLSVRFVCLFVSLSPALGKGMYLQVPFRFVGSALEYVDGTTYKLIWQLLP